MSTELASLFRGIALVVVALVAGVVGSAVYVRDVVEAQSIVLSDPYGILRKVANGEAYALSYGPNRLDLQCADDAAEAVRSTSVDVLPEQFENCVDELRGLLAAIQGLADEDLFAVFVTIVANRLAPYGDSAETDWRAIPGESALNCAQHSIFISEAISHFTPGAKVVRYGLDGGAIANHAMVAYRRGEISLILDGTTALVAFDSMEKVLDGKLVNAFRMWDFYVSTDESIDIFRRTVRGAMRLGAIRREHIIYRELDSVEEQASLTE